MKKNCITVALLIIAATLAACAYTPPPVPDIVWPIPPDEPRIKYVASYKSKNDFAKTAIERFKEALFGPEFGPLLVGKPNGVTTDSIGRILLADALHQGVLVIDPQVGRIDLWGREGSINLVLPLGVAVDSQDNVYVSDARLRKILTFDKTGKLVYSIGDEKQLVNPTGVAIDKKRNRLLVADSKGNKIKIFDLKGEPLLDIEGSGQPGGNFFTPISIAVDKNGNFYVVEAYNFRVQIFDADGKYIKSFGRIGDCVGCFARPKGIAIDSDGHIYVVDASFENFQIFDQEGQLLLFVGSGGVRPGEFSLPSGIWIDKDDKIYVTDQAFNPRVQVFQYLKKK